MKRLTLLASVLLTISATSVQAQSVICEKFGAGQIIANRVCPLGYVKKGEVATTNGGGFGSAGMQAAQDMINRNEADRQARLAREAAAAEAQRQRNYEAQQAAERRRQQNVRNSSLPESARCLEGSWNIAVISNSKGGANLDITDNGLVYLGGSLMSHQPGISIYLGNNTLNLNGNGTDGAELRQRLTLEGDVLIGTVTTVEVKQGFFKDKKLPAVTRNLRGTRTSPAPPNCGQVEKINQTEATTNRGATIAEGLASLSDLYEQGLLSEEEFKAAKRRLLGL